MDDRQQKTQALGRYFAEADALDAPLDARLGRYAEQSRLILPDVLAAYDRLVAHLFAAYAGRAGTVPQVGDELPEFVLADRDGNLVSLGELAGAGPVVVSINRGHWCPYCRLELRALARAVPQLQRRGAQVVSIVPESGALASKLVNEHALPFKVLSDIDLGYALSIGLLVWIGEEMIGVYRQLGIDLPSFQGNDGWFLPIPATFVVGSDRRIRASLVDPDFRRRMTIEQIEAALPA